jgi:cell fate regulator YaaT (PSP1 superfamily)
MPEIYGTVYGVEFHSVGKMYVYSSSEAVLKPGDFVLAMSEFGLDVGRVRFGPVEMRIDELKEELRPIVRTMTDEDWETHRKNKEEAASAMQICQDLIEKHSLPMRLLEARYMFDRSRIVFYFGADSRVDFRELVKDLARAFRTRIELRQVGIRDEVKMTGSLGLCGMTACCARFLRQFESITLKHAKKQQLLINPAKISGRCGRLLCCLSYEKELYEHELMDIPDEGSLVDYEGKTCKVLTVNIFMKVITLVADDGQMIKVQFDDFRKSQKSIIQDANAELLIKNRDEDISIDD